MSKAFISSTIELSGIPNFFIILFMVITGLYVLAIRSTVLYDEMQTASDLYNKSLNLGYYEFIQTLSVTTYKSGKPTTEYIIG